MKTIKRLGVLTTLCVCGFILKVFADPPVLSIAPAGTNLLITVTNGVSTANYDLYWSPVLDNPNYPWTVVALGDTGQTNFTVTKIYDSEFFRVLLETTNGVPPWKAADPNDPDSGVLVVFIDSPVNGAVLN